MTRPTLYPLARQGVFATIQGEGALLGTPMTFIRLAGCSVGCPLCDTDYRVHERVSVQEIVDRVGFAEWVWITGGEPSDHDLGPLLTALGGRKVAVATSGIKPIEWVDFLSVSPHGKPADLAFCRGMQTQINLVPSLNGLRLSDWTRFDASGFDYRFVTPPWSHQGERPEMVAECIEWVKGHPGWRLGVQAHKTWGVA